MLDDKIKYNYLTIDSDIRVIMDALPAESSSSYNKGGTPIFGLYRANPIAEKECETYVFSSDQEEPICLFLYETRAFEFVKEQERLNPDKVFRVQRKYIVDESDIKQESKYE
jgi:hypothetical protein